MMSKKLNPILIIPIFTFIGSLILFQNPTHLSAMSGCPDNLLCSQVDWRVQDSENIRGVTAVRYDETEKCLVLDCDLKGKDLHLSQGEIVIDLNYIPCLEANAPVNMTGRLIKAVVQVPPGFVGPESVPNGCQVFVKDTSLRSQYGTRVDCTHNGSFTVKLSPSTVNPYRGETTPGFDPTKIKFMGIKIAINTDSTFLFKGKIKITMFDVNPTLPFSSPPEIPGNLPVPFVTAESKVDMHTEGFYIVNNRWFIVGGNWRPIAYRQNFGATAWFPYGNGISLHPGFVGTRFEWFRQAGVTLVRVGLVDDGTTLLDRDGNVVGYNEIFKRDVSKFLELASQNHVKVEFSLVDFPIAGKGEEIRGVWLKGRRKVIEDPQVRQRFIQNFLTPFLQEFGNSPVIFGFDIINEPEWIISKDHGGGWEDTSDLINKAETPVDFEQFKNFVSQCTDKIRLLAPGKFVSIGLTCQYIELMNNLNAKVDYSAVHYYPWMGDLESNLLKVPGNKPWNLEEFPGKGNIYSYFNTVFNKGGAGALLWNLTPENDMFCYKFEEEEKKLQAIRTFVDYADWFKPVISLDKTNLYFASGIFGSGTGAQTLLINNSGTGTLNWNISDNAAWLNCTPVSGTGRGTVSVSVNPTGLLAGSYAGVIKVSDPRAVNSPQTVLVTLKVLPSGATNGPFGDFSTPLNGSMTQGSIPVTGWALDDLQVANVKIYLEQNRKLVYIGDAVFIEGARPDLEQAFPTYPLNYKGGWGYMLLTNFLPNGGNGTFSLHAIAVDVEGQQTTLGINTITCNNAHAIRPFGAIDTPFQKTVSGKSYNNAGWVLTPQPNSIPFDGSTIIVYVDGRRLGHANYNIYRSDIAGLFPSYANSNGAGANFILDTTAFANGMHIIYWTAADNAGNVDGIGSRYFTVQNNQKLYPFHQLDPAQQPKNMNSPGLPLSNTSAQEPEPIEIMIGFMEDLADSDKQVIYPNENGIFQVDLHELDRIEIHLHSSIRPGIKSHDSYLGYLLVGEQVRSLPIGSTFDRREGIFYWQPGAGFLGNYSFMFIGKDNSGSSIKKRIDINILPKYSN